MPDSIYANPSPVTGNDFDGQSHSWGMKFTVSTDANCVGGRAWVPAAGRPTTFLWQLWRVGDSTKIAESNLNAAGQGSPSSGAWMSFSSNLFSTPGDVTLDNAGTYIVCVHFQGGDGVYTDDGSETFPTGTGAVSSSTGRFSNSIGSSTMPATDYVAWFFADVTVSAGATVALTPATFTLAGQAMTATPGMVTVNLTPATLAFAAQGSTATPGMVTVPLTPAQFVLAATPFVFTGTPGWLTPSTPGPTLTPSVPQPAQSPSAAGSFLSAYTTP